MKNIFAKVWLVTLVVGFIALAAPVCALAQDDDDREEAARLTRLERQVRQLGERQQPMSPRMGSMPVGPMAQAQVAAVPATCQQPQGTRRCPVKCALLPLLVVLGIIHVMLAVWVFTDIRKRGEGSGIFIVLALIAGILGTILYALVRLGDRVGEKKV